ncbi:hypothetical protein GCM10022403_071370 [Streptomyces coacervatus]|uniref:Protein phosphatase n=1 Tax=Streptomyces coacervatus TaxID=647381 RepID=A0ABP7IW80_9ACTN|nr:hypothetical protein [Streptomyces coacervatus]MDF2269736.1 hypothetical protein [Streptomyces coacervatus]
MGDEAKLIDPSGIPHFIGDLATLDTDVMLLTADAGQFRASGSDVHTEFQGLSAFYHAPEAEQLFATTLPVKQKSDAFADDLEKVTTALSDYSFEVQPLVRKLDALKADATAFVNSLPAGDDWRKDQDKVDHNNDLWHDVNHTVAAFEAAERTAYNKIMALIGGTKLTADDGSHGKNMYGYQADDLDHAQATPWGAPVEREYEGWSWLVHQGKQVWDGVWHDGVIGTIHGVGTLFGSDGGDAAGEAWKNLAKLSTAGVLTTSTFGAWWLVPADKQPSWLRDSRTVYVQATKGFVAYDQWKTNPARAAGAFGFNVLTVAGTEGIGSAASGAGKAGAAARALSVAGKVGRAIDPMTYVGKVGKFAFVKVGDTFATLKNLHTGTYLDMANAGERYTPAEHPLPLRERPVSVPRSAIEYIDANGNPVYLTNGGHILNADGSLRQHATEAKTELSADDRTTLDSTPHTPPSGVRIPEPIAIHGDNSPGASVHPPAGTSSHLPNGDAAHDLAHGASSSHEPPTTPGRGHSGGPETSGDHTPTGHEPIPSRDHGASGPDAGDHGGALPPSGHHLTDGPNALPEQPHDYKPMVRGGETEQQLRDAIKGIPGKQRPKPDVLDRALERLASEPNGQQVADVIASGHFNQSEGFGQVVSSLGARKEGMFQPGADQILFADDLARSGIPPHAIDFEHKIPAGADADIRITDESGAVYTYQMKHLNNPMDQVSEITRGKYLLQLARTEADHRIMLVDGGRGTRADWMSNGSYDALMDIHNGGRGPKGEGITFVVRLKDGTLVIPPDAKTDPKDML